MIIQGVVQHLLTHRFLVHRSTSLAWHTLAARCALLGETYKLQLSCAHSKSLPDKRVSCQAVKDVQAVVLDLGPRFLVLELDQARLRCCPCSKAGLLMASLDFMTSLYLSCSVEAAMSDIHSCVLRSNSFGCLCLCSQSNCCTPHTPM